MGSFASKPVSEGKRSAMDALDVTPKVPKILPFDPRSPSTDISRTPIAVTIISITYYMIIWGHTA